MVDRNLCYKRIWGKKKEKKRRKKKQLSVGKELIPNTHSREVIKLDLSLWYL
jgi:hypothetical protein